jgi:cyclophilin family peptidyl-prolyl cis-trans isomerase
MSKKQKPTKKKPVKPLSTMQQVAIAVMIVGVIAIVWVMLSMSQGNSASVVPTLSGDAAAQSAQGAAATQPVEVNAPTPNGKQYSAAPPMTIDKKKQYFATFKMAKGGEFVVQLYPDKAPITVNSFVFLAREGFYIGTTFHRVLEGFMAQGGDPTGSGMGGPGYEFENEVSDLLFDKPGVVAMANAGPNTNGSQFFIMFGPGGLSPNDYTIFGQVTSGMDVVNAITRRDPSNNPTFTGDAIESVTITEK